MKTVLACTLLSILLVCAEERKHSLSTASVHDENIKPTTPYRRFYEDPKVKESQTYINLFEKKKSERSKGRSDRASLWNWDHWCQLQPQIGTCINSQTRFYYNAQLDTCEPFKYSGCGGNKNRFSTKTECERYCKGVAFADVKENDWSTSCSLQTNPGLCVALFDRYYYDVNARDCKSFVYSGCGGNDNRFHTKHKCNKKCGQEKDLHST